MKQETEYFFWVYVQLFVIVTLFYAIIYSSNDQKKSDKDEV